MGAILRCAVTSLLGLALAAQICLAQETSIHPTQSQLDEIERLLLELQGRISTTEQHFSNLDRRLSTVEQHFSELEPRLRDITKDQDRILGEFKSELDKLRELKKAIDEAALTVSSAQSNLAGQYLDILGTQLAIIALLVGSVGTVTALYIKKLVQEDVTRSAETRIRKLFEHEERELKQATERIAQFYGLVSLAMGMAKYSIAHYEAYRRDKNNFVKFLTGHARDTDDGFKRTVLMATVMAEGGLSQCKSHLFQEEIANGNNEAWVTYTRLLNHWVYHRTIDLSCQELTSDEKEKDVVTLLSGAQECWMKSRDPRRSVDWYKLCETAGFAMLVHGSEVAKEQGRDMVRELLLGRGAPPNFEAPDLNWIAGMVDRVYYPVKPDGAREDIFGLGIFDVEPWEKMPRALNLSQTAPTSPPAE